MNYDHEPKFTQAVNEVKACLGEVLERHPKYKKYKVFERLIIPERVIMFRVPWVDDAGEVQVSWGCRVQTGSKLLGPDKGGLRFHPTVDLDTLKFLAFEQVLKNALTGLPMGGAKGGADIDPKKMSESEIMRFCQSYMQKLWRYISPDTDIPAGDIGVGEREIGYLFGMYKDLKNEFTGILTGKRPNWGGSLLRPEATGYGLVYFAREMLKKKGDTLAGKICLISGSGNAAQYTTEKLLCYGAKVLTMSDSDGYIYDSAGIDREKLDWIMELKNVRRGRIEEYKSKFTRSKYNKFPGTSLGHYPMWHIECDCAFPCATENELTKHDAQYLINNNIKLVAEGANMPCTPEAIKILKENGVMYGPGKAANAGGVAVSGLEMSQNSMRYSWPMEEVDSRLKTTMKHIYAECVSAAEEYGVPGDLEAGANIAGFIKVADAMIEQGVV